MSIPTDLETRFQEPPGWRWHSFTRNGRSIRFGTASPPDTIPDAVVVCLQGVREFSEKYFETARWCLDHNLAFWVFDWAGQGKSTRFLPHKRHSHGFTEDILDLDYFINEYIKHASVHPDKGRIPMVMLAHSMGANLGLRYLQEHPVRFACAAFSAPMLGIKVFENIPQGVADIATALVALLLGKSYVIGGHDWKDEPLPPEETLSGDPVRSSVHNLWGAADPELTVGAVTYRWLHEAQKSCRIVQNSGFLKEIITPTLFAIPGQEHLVDNILGRKLISQIDGARILDLPESYHEILMERDDIRGPYLDAFYALIKETVIDKPHSLKPF